MRGAVAAFAATGLAAVLVIAVAVVWVARRDATATAVSDARDLTIREGKTAVEPVLSDGILTHDPAAIAAVDDVVRTRILSGRVVRVKVWAPDGTIVYSDASALIGRRFPLEEDETATLIGARPAVAQVSDLSRPENELEQPFKKLLEVYDSVHTHAGSPLLYEAYLRFSTVSKDGQRTLRSMLPALVIGLAVLFLVQIPLAWSLARRVERSRIEEQRLLRRALEAGEVERRHVAADLHDGVVQSLVGTSLSLTAAAGEAERAGLPEVSAKVGSAAAQLRQGVRDLRSLIVAIAPPRLHDEGLAAAMGDLVSPLKARGIKAELRVDDVHLAPEVETLVYRTTQEALRNVARHARASRVAVEVHAHGDRVRVEVADDGVGFSPDLVTKRQADGHVGLHLLAELAAEAGGRLDIEASPGVGTRLRLEVPTA